MKTLVVYYSRSGHNRGIAQQAACKLGGCDTYELKPAKGYGGLFGFLRAGRSSLKGEKVELKDLENMPDIKAYDLVVCAGPVWAGRLCPPVTTFLKDYGKDIKKAAFIITRGGDEPYQGIFGLMDDLCGQKSCARWSVYTLDKDLGAGMEKFIKNALESF